MQTRGAVKWQIGLQKCANMAKSEQANASQFRENKMSVLSGYCELVQTQSIQHDWKVLL